MYTHISFFFILQILLPVNLHTLLQETILFYFISFHFLFSPFSFPLQKIERIIGIFYESSFIKSWERSDCLKPGVRIYLRIDDPVPLVPRFSCNREDVIIRRGGGGETEKRERERGRNAYKNTRRNSFYSYYTWRDSNITTRFRRIFTCKLSLMLRIQCECDDLLNSLNCNSSVENQRIKPLPDKISNRWKTDTHFIYTYILWTWK